MKPSIVVLGGSNTDMVVQLPRLPKPGETILGGVFSRVQGGKGANQAVAAARAGGHVTFVGRVGSDSFGREAREALSVENIDLQHFTSDVELPSGIALICVDSRGENVIAVAPGANGNVSPVDVERASGVIRSADVVLAQLEVPLAAVRAAGTLAASARNRFILNPAPALQLDDEIMHTVSILTPNEHEAGVLTGLQVTDDESVVRAADVLSTRGVQTVMITLGARGVYFTEAHHGTWVPAFHVEAVDSTAAGDVFNGALAVALGEGRPMFDAVRFANAAGAIAVTRRGAQPSVPTRDEIEKLLHS